MAGAVQHPFQCLVVVTPPGGPDVFLLAACGERLISTSLGKDATQFEWNAPPSVSETKQADTVERPAEKQKTATPASVSSNVIKLTMSPDNHYAVVVTEDKLVRVLEIHADGQLSELSQRAMPKRPCAIQVLPDNATILCGDKFGDVYSLPLLPAENAQQLEVDVDAGAEKVEKAQAFKPSASSTTVHTKRNRKALEAQLKQKNILAKTKEPLTFEHKLLLGHVSMLTDLTFATREIEGKQRNYIITADRDEHIRISRSPPQSHIIEGYCLGHTEYVSKICLVPATDLLVSGGGDNWIGVWDWPSFKLKKELDITRALQAGLKDRSTRLGWPSPKVENINVSGIWIVPMKVGELIKMDRPVVEDKPVCEPAVVVACEGVPVMLVCPAADLLKDDAEFQPIPISEGPILDVTYFQEMGIVTIDDRKNADKRVWSFRLERDLKSKTGIVEVTGDIESAATINKLNAVAAGVENEKALDGLLYGVANLRKRGSKSDAHGGEAEGGAADEVDEEQDGVNGEAD